MILVDTSVWIEHLRRGEPTLTDLLSRATILMHPFVLGELACGNLKNRTLVLLTLGALPEAKQAFDAEVLNLLDHRRIWGKGIGWIDGHLLASALLSGCQFWTLDKRLEQVARGAGVAVYTPN